jgi:ribosomal protein S18 acetylase RimI-like enzyme
MGERFECVEQNLRNAMRFFARAQGDVREMPGVALVCSGVDYSVFNAALLSESVTKEDGGLERRIAIANVHYAMRGFKWSFWVCEDLLDRKTRRTAADVFARHGMHSVVAAPGMIAERLKPPDRPLPRIDCKPVEDGPTRLAFCHITSIAFDLPFAIARAIYDAEHAWKGDFIGHVGYWEGQAVCSVATVNAAGAAGVYSLGTLPQHRRRGFAEAILRHALEQARAQAGVERTVLQATRSGLKLYQRLGYETVTRFAVYATS